MTYSSPGAVEQPVSVVAAGAQVDYVEKTTDFNPGDTAEHDLLTGVAVTYDGATRVKVEFFCADVDTVSTGGIIFRLYDGVTALCRISDARGAGGSAPSIPAKGEVYFTPAAGVRTYKITAACTASGAIARAGTANGGGASYAPMFMRITTA